MVKPDLCHRRSVVFPGFAGVARQTSATGGTPITTTATPDRAGDGTPDLCHAVAVECGTSQQTQGESRRQRMHPAPESWAPELQPSKPSAHTAAEPAHWGEPAGNGG